LPGFRIEEVRGKTLGIIGYGSIGRTVARMARALGMKILVARVPGRHYALSIAPRRVSFDVVLRQSDYLTIHTPLSPLTRNLIGAAQIRKMKAGAFLINMARGGIVNEKALKSALVKGKLGGAAFDVLSQEPPPRRHPLSGAPRLILTPHVSWATREVRQRLIAEVLQNIKSWRAGGRRNRVV